MSNCLFIKATEQCSVGCVQYVTLHPSTLYRKAMVSLMLSFKKDAINFTGKAAEEFLRRLFNAGFYCEAEWVAVLAEFRKINEEGV